MTDNLERETGLIEWCKKASGAIYLACEASVADDISSHLREIVAVLRERTPATVEAEVVERLVLELPDGIKVHVGPDFKLVYKHEFLSLVGPVKGRIPEERRASQLVREAWNKLPPVPSLGGALTSSSPASAWRDIANAPTTARRETGYGEGLRVLVYGPQIGVCAGTLHRFDDNTATVAVSHLGGDAVAHWGVTHWRPLPSAPGKENT